MNPPPFDLQGARLAQWWALVALALAAGLYLHARAERATELALIQERRRRRDAEHLAAKREEQLDGALAKISELDPGNGNGEQPASE